ncbi:MAG: helix-turn-helix transcriptional regulator [Oscillospiraceae bacterium]|nr:helix-turn-helix transcriptional regulator [Oscillospiraceae bacterium]
MQHYQRIRDLREDRDLTQDALCKQLYMHKTTYTNYEQGKHSVPLDFAVTLAEFYDVSLDYIAGLTASPVRAGECFSPDEIRLVEQYRFLSERRKGRTEQFIEQMCSEQETDNSRRSG